MSTTLDDARRYLDQQRARTSRRHTTRYAELVLLCTASALTVALMWSAYGAKTGEFGDLAGKLASNQIVNLNGGVHGDVIAPLLDAVSKPEDRQFVADQIASRAARGNFSHVGEIALLHSAPGAPRLTRTELHDIKPFFIVRTPEQFRRTFWLYAGGFVAAFFLLHVFWRIRGFAGDQLILPVIEALCGIGMVLMVSIGDPLRDSLMFASFGNGIFIGLAAMLILSSLDYNRRFRRFSYTFIAAAAVLGVLLWMFGKGPTGSDAKVTLFGLFEPVEIMRLFIVAFLAGYLGENWSALRDMRIKSRLARALGIPRLDYITPIAIGVGISVLLFYLVKDNGPALVIGVLFLLMYGIARKRVLGALVGFLLVIGVFWLARVSHFQTVSQRIEIWSSPWRNTIPGGDQVAQSLWAFASGGTWGEGPGRGSAADIPAGATDLILSSAGEEFGFAGELVIFCLYGLLVWRGMKIALNASGPYAYFLAMGMTLVITLQLILIAGGILALIPLSGVVSPFLCFGKTSMVANFAAFAVLLAISSRSVTAGQRKEFGLPTYAVAALLAVCWIGIVGRCAYVQVVKGDDILVRDAEVRYRNNALGLEYNPRLNNVIRNIARGDVLDRNGVPLATSRWDTLEKYRSAYQKLGVSIDQTADKDEIRHYPLGPEFFYLVGDMRSGLQSFIRTNAVERASRKRLIGFDEHMETVRLVDNRKPTDGKPPLEYVRTTYDYRPLIPLVRHGIHSSDPQVRAFLAQNRDVKMSIDAGLQMRVSDILKQHLAPQNLKGAAVVLDPDTGDLLASVSYPWPEQDQFALFRKNADRTLAADWQDRAVFGLYPPGSSFKIVTAIAALRQNPNADRDVFECKALGDGRVGNYVGKSKRPVRDDVQDHFPHGRVDMAKGIIVSCNAFFAQLGYQIGAGPLVATAKQFHISASPGNSEDLLRPKVAQAAYGQGDVVVTPFQMARVAATVADSGSMPEGRWVIDESNTRADAPTTILDMKDTQKIADAMRQVVASPVGTGKVLRNATIPIAGKTGTAQLDRGDPHAWFIGYAPYGSGKGKRIAFAVLVEHGEYGGKTAAPIAGEIVTAAQQAGFVGSAQDLK